MESLITLTLQGAIIVLVTAHMIVTELRVRFYKRLAKGDQGLPGPTGPRGIDGPACPTHFNSFGDNLVRHPQIGDPVHYWPVTGEQGSWMQPIAAFITGIRMEQFYSDGITRPESEGFHYRPAFDVTLTLMTDQGPMVLPEVPWAPNAGRAGHWNFPITHGDLTSSSPLLPPSASTDAQ